MALVESHYMAKCGKKGGSGVLAHANLHQPPGTCPFVVVQAIMQVHDDCVLFMCRSSSIASETNKHLRCGNCKRAASSYLHL